MLYGIVYFFLKNTNGQVDGRNLFFLLSFSFLFLFFLSIPIKHFLRIKFEELGKSFNELSNEDRWEIMSKSGGSALRILLAAFMWYMFFVYVFVSAIWLAFFVALTSF